MQNSKKGRNMPFCLEETVKIFDLRVNEKMWPNGANKKLHYPDAVGRIEPKDVIKSTIGIFLSSYSIQK